MTARTEQDAPEARSPIGPLTFESAARSHEGCVRLLNEDRFLERVDAGLWAVADGMGGHRAGEVASARIIEALAGIQTIGSGHSTFAAVHESMRRVNAELQHYSKALPEGGLVGSTIVILLMQDRHYACLWAGDSRAYLFRGGELKQLTHDHSVVQQLIDDGRLLADRAKGHPRASVITRAVGAADRLDLEARYATAAAGDIFLLCSDGLSNTLSEAVMTEHLKLSSLEKAADSLLAAALHEGAKDNVTLVLVGCS